VKIAAPLRPVDSSRNGALFRLRRSSCFLNLHHACNLCPHFSQDNVPCALLVCFLLCVGCASHSAVIPIVTVLASFCLRTQPGTARKEILATAHSHIYCIHLSSSSLPGMPQRNSTYLFCRRQFACLENLAPLTPTELVEWVRRSVTLSDVCCRRRSAEGG
jgi:hypothetical protein